MGLIDGPPDASGKAIARRATLLQIPAQLLTNIIGALVVFTLIVWAMPKPTLEDSDALLLWNLVAASIYLVFACIVGTVWGLARFRGARKWMVEEREPTDNEIRQTLRAPLRLLRVNLFLWTLAAALFSFVNAFFSGTLALMIGLTILLGGITTSAASYLISERIARPYFARALAHGAPDKPVLPGVTIRAFLAWALGSGVPLLGMFIIALLDIAGLESISETELAIATLALTAVGLIVGLFITLQAARQTRAPVLSVRRALRKVEKGDFDAEVPVFDGSELGLLQVGFNRMVFGLREREEIRDLFGRHVGEDVARAAMERGIELGGEELEVAVLFVDLTGSTELAADRKPGEVVELLNEFFRVVIEEVEENGGFVNKFMGDGALAIYGAPLPLDEPARCALASARTLAERLKRDLPEDLDAGVGVSYGRVVAGNIGTETRFEYTVIGDPVNEAARLCDLAKQEDARVLASQAAVEAGGDEADAWDLGEAVTLRGRNEETVTASPSGSAS